MDANATTLKLLRATARLGYTDEIAAAEAYLAQLERERDEVVAEVARLHACNAQAANGRKDFRDALRLARHERNAYAQETERLRERFVKASAELAALRAQPCRVEHEPTVWMFDAHDEHAQRIYRAGEKSRVAHERARVADASPQPAPVGEWTREAPTVAGWYWLHSQHGKHAPVEIWPRDAGGTGWLHWSVPLTLPEEGKPWPIGEPMPTYAKPKGKI